MIRGQELEPEALVSSGDRLNVAHPAGAFRRPALVHRVSARGLTESSCSL